MPRRKSRTAQAAPRAQPAKDAAPPTPAAQPMGTARLWAFRLVSAVALPLLLLGATEGLLRLAGVGHPGTFTVPCVARGRAAVCENHRFVEPFFPAGASRAPPPLAFPAQKEPGTFRIFVLGESAALGDPERAYGFSRYLEVMLRDRFAGMRFEVINASTTAINSHVLLPMARDLARYEPDLFILYIGNNEVVGPFGAGTVLTTRAPSLRLIRARIALESTRLGQLLGRALRRSAGGGAHQEWRGMEMFVGEEVPATAPGLARVRANFRANLRDLIAVARDAGARVLVSTVATNLRDSAPFAARHRAGLAPADLAEWNARVEAGIAHERAGRCPDAIREYRAAEAIDDQHADLQFRLARCLRAGGDLGAARVRYERARDLDVLRFRADTEVNTIVRAVAAQAGPGVELIDAERAFAFASPDGVPGEELFYEHVHPTPRGNDLLARTIFPGVVHALPEAAQRAAASGALPAPDECDRRLALTRSDRRRVARDVFRRLEGAPFTNQLDHSAWLEAARRAGDQEVDPPAETAAEYRQALARAPADPVLHARLGALLAPDQPAAAIAELRQAIDALPTDGGAREQLAGALGRLGRHDEAVREIRALLAFKADYPPAFVDLGYLLAEKGAFDEATAAYERASQLAPSLAPGVLGEVGRIRMHQHRFAEAAAAFQRALDAGSARGAEAAELHAGRVRALDELQKQRR